MVDSAELFEAIAHTVRIKILKILEKQPASFASLKRQLGIDSSGNLDFHLKKLSALVAVREDGLYGLTEAGKEALLSIEAVEMWTEMERRRPKIQFRKMPKAALFLGSLEICTTVSIFWFFLAIINLSVSWDNFWGYLFFGALLLVGFRSGFGIFLCLEWSRTMVLAKSALIITMSLFLLTYLKPGAVVQPMYVALYVAFVAAETATVVLASTRSVKDFLGIRNAVRLSRRAIIGSLFCMSNGLLLVLLELRQSSEGTNVFTSISDTSVLCGLLIMVGGVLILLRSNTLGAAISIIFGLFPPSYQPGNFPLPTALHAFDLIVKIDSSSVYVLVAAVIVGSLPIVGGLLALSSGRRIRVDVAISRLARALGKVKAFFH